MPEDSPFTPFGRERVDGAPDESGLVPDRLVRELRRGGQLAQERAQTYLDELLERSRKRTDALVDTVRRELGNQIAALGLATREDVERLERRLSHPGRAPAARAQVRARPPALGDTGENPTGQP